MIVERAMHPDWTSNSYLVADEPGGAALVVDTGADPTPLMARAHELGVRVELVLLTHFHPDHVAHTDTWVRAFGCEVAAHPLEAARLRGGPSAAGRMLADEQVLGVGGLSVRCLHLPGHTDGQLAFVVEHAGAVELFTGDTLFKGSIGGTRAPAHTTIEDLRQSIMDRLMALPRAWSVRPGHTDPTTLGAEWATNPFVLAWRGARPLLDEPVRVGEREATLLVEARDYDGGTKARVRWPDGSEDVIPGSRVRKLDA